MEGVNEGGGGDARGGVGLQLGLGVAEGDCGLVSERGEMLCVGDLLRERGGFVEAAWHTWFYVNIVACFLKFSSAYTSAIPSPSSCFSSSRRFSFNRRSWQLAVSTARQEDNGHYLSTDFSAVEPWRNRGPTWHAWHSRGLTPRWPHHPPWWGFVQNVVSWTYESRFHITMASAFAKK